MMPFLGAIGLGSGLSAGRQKVATPPHSVASDVLIRNGLRATGTTGVGMACAIRGAAGQRVEVELLELSDWEATIAVAVSSGALRAVASCTISRKDACSLAFGLEAFGRTEPEFRARLGRRLLVSLAGGEGAAVNFNVAISDAPHGAFDATIETDEFQVRHLGGWLRDRVGSCLVDSAV